MKRLFLLLLLIPALLFCSCNNQTELQTTAPTESEQVDETKLLEDLATEVALAFAYGKFEDVEKYMLFSHKQQSSMLFEKALPPYEYEGYTFESDEAVVESVRSQLISSENPEFTVTITNAKVEYIDTEAGGIANFDVPERNLTLLPGTHLDGPTAKVIVSFTIDNGEESEGTMDVCFAMMNGEWKVYSPSVSGYFLRLYQSSAPAD